MTHATATLTAEDAPDLGPGWRRLALDCEHGTTEGAFKNGDGSHAPSLGDAAIVRLLLLRHFEAERCWCTRSLRRRYGLTGVR